jgi:hypothetical protein
MQSPAGQPPQSVTFPNGTTFGGSSGGGERFFGRLEVGAQRLDTAVSAPAPSSADRADLIAHRVGGLTAGVFGYEAERGALARAWE